VPNGAAIYVSPTPVCTAVSRCYRRVRTVDGDPDAQRDAPGDAGCDQVLIDKASGKLARRPELDKGLLVTRERDQVVITKLDRLGRSLEHLISLVPTSFKPGASTCWCSITASTRLRLGRMLFQILGAIAEFRDSPTIAPAR